jgi:hypothetical protein
MRDTRFFRRHPTNMEAARAPFRVHYSVTDNLPFAASALLSR